MKSETKAARAEVAAAGEAGGRLSRQPWTTSRITGSPEPPPPYQAVRTFTNLKFSSPVAMAAAPGMNRLFVVEQYGKIHSFPIDRSVRTADLFLDLKKDIQTLALIPNGKEVSNVYGLAFHPKFAENRECFVAYAISPKQGNPLPDGARVSRFKVTQLDPPRCDPASEEVVLTFLEGGHMGSCLAFGPDGMLYITTGDAAGPSPPDPLDTGQGVDDLLACVLRIDVNRRDEGRAYAIPKDNPFVSLPGARGEIWAYGFRNPWKISFDRTTGDLWLADVGWELWELVHRIERGGNYGWSIMEGPQPVRKDLNPGPSPISPAADALPHSISASITGGYVYRGKRFPELVGHYIYGDWETRRLWGARVEKTKDGEGKELTTLAPRRDLTDPSVRLVSFGEDNDGELYLLDYDNGGIYELERNEAVDNSATFPLKLSETGLFESIGEQKTARGVLPFSINAEQWLDYATAERFVAIPGTESIQYFPQPVESPGSMFQRIMAFPKDTVFGRTLSLEMRQGDQSTQRPIETQVLHFDGREFRGYSYAWNDDGTDAELVEAEGREQALSVVDTGAPGGKRSQLWTYASRSQCLQCHNPWAMHTLAFNRLQLNREHDYGGVRRNQLDALAELGVLVPAGGLKRVRNEHADKPNHPPPLVNPHDESADLTGRARSYLHANCAHCHRSGGGGTTRIELQYDMALKNANLLGVAPTQGSFGIQDAAVIAPGDPYRSVLYFRMAKLGRGHMPHLGAELIDERGLQLIHDWITSIPAQDGGDRSSELYAELEKTCRTDDAERLAAGVAKMLKSTRGAMILTHAIAEHRLPEPAIKAAIEAGVSHSDPVIRDLFERFVPDESRGERLGNRIKPERILALSGDADRGRALFFQPSTMQCKTCHQIGGEGGKVGPDLSQIGKKLNRAQLLESLVEPSKTIAQEYRSYLIETSDGRNLTGLVVSRNERELVIRDAQNSETRLGAAEAEQLLPQAQSIMPEGLLRDLTPQQAADLVAYLQSLR